MARQSVLRAGVTMMLRKEVVTVTYMITVLTGIRAALRTAEAPKVPVVPQPLRVAILLRAQRVEARLQTARKLIHPAVVTKRRIRVLWILMMMATMQFMRMMIMTGIAIRAMMTMLPVWMTPWKMRIGKSRRDAISCVKVYGNNAKGRTDIGMNMRQTITEENLNKSEVRNWIITGARIVMGFI